MRKRTPFPKLRRLKKEDGTTATSFNGKLHNWDEPALVEPTGVKRYFLYGIEYTRDQWKEAKSNLTGLPFYKDPAFRGQIRF